MSNIFTVSGEECFVYLAQAGDAISTLIKDEKVMDVLRAISAIDRKGRTVAHIFGEVVQMASPVVSAHTDECWKLAAALLTKTEAEVRQQPLFATMKELREVFEELDAFIKEVSVEDKKPGDAPKKEAGKHAKRKV